MTPRCSHIARVVTALLIAIGLLGSGRSALAQPASSQSQCQTPASCLAIGIQAYVYAYPLVLLGVSERVATNVPNAATTFGRAPINQFSNNPLPTAAYTDIVLPSVSTPYSNAFLDLTKEPIILHLPDLGNRFFLMQVLDAWTNVGGADPGCLQGSPGFCGLGTRYGTQAGDYAFVGPTWKGTLPPGIKQIIQMPTNTAWIAGRTLTTGSPEDLAAVQAIQQRYTLTPLHAFGKSYSPPAHAPVDPKVNTTTPPVTQVEQMDAGAYFSLLADLMRPNSPLPADGPMVTQLAQIGIIPGKPFNINSLDPLTRQALELAAQQGNTLVNDAAHHVDLTTTNWSMPLDLGVYGTQYLERAGVARGGIGANLYLDAVYAVAFKDGAANSLNGANRYTLTFAAGQFPPANPQAFWSVTLYNQDSENLYASPNGRNALGIPAVQNHLPCANADGSLTLYVQHDQPDPTTQPTQYCNWLPAPSGGFLLLLRVYWPGQTLFNHEWIPPAVQRVS